MTVEDPSHPTDTRFLHVLQGADSGASMVPAMRLQSSQGTAFDGAAFGSVVVYFPVSASGGFAATTFPAPAGTHTMLVTGLTPGASYGVQVQGGSVVVTPGGSGGSADSAGVLRVTF
jgi:hypothetical protein